MLKIKLPLNVKKGNTLIFLFIIFVIFFILVFSIVIIYFQICIKPQVIEEELKFIVKNEAIINADKELLRLNSYKFDLEKMKLGISEKLKRNYSNVILKSIEYNKEENYFDVWLDYSIKPIILFNDKKLNIKINKKIKFKLLEGVEN